MCPVTHFLQVLNDLIQYWPNKQQTLKLVLFFLTLGPIIREKISRGLHKTRKEPFIRVRLILDANSSYKWFTA